MHEPLSAFFADQADGLCHTDYWQRLAAIWRDADAAGRRDERWAGVWEQARLAPGSDLGLMTPEERDALAALPDPVPVSRRADEGDVAWDLAEAPERTLPRSAVVALFLVDGEPHLVAST